MTKPEFDVIVCGSLHLDIMVDAPHLPQLDETVPGTKWGMVCGGKGGNQAVMAARLGAKTAMIGRTGKDDFGAKLHANLDKWGVDTQAVSTDGSAGSGMSVAVLDANGDYGAVIVSGSNLTLDPDNCANDWAAIGGAGILILQNEIPESVNISIARQAKLSGATTILNAAPVRANSAELLGLIDVLVVNRVEAQMLAGGVVGDVPSTVAALANIDINCSAIIVTLGGEGLVVWQRGSAPIVIAPQKVKVVSTHGAGDCFIGALASHLALGNNLETAARFANRAAAHYVSLSLEAREKPLDFA
jgi:ribokinase